MYYNDEQYCIILQHMKYTPGARRLSALHTFGKKKLTHQVTAEGFGKLQKDYEDLLAQRPEAVRHLKLSREMGDLSENGYYKASRAKLSFIDNRLFHLKNAMKNAVVVAVGEKDIVSLGCTIIVDDDGERKQYSIVGVYEANPAEGKISTISPLGKSLLGKKVGDTVELFAPLGKKVYTVLEIL